MAGVDYESNYSYFISLVLGSKDYGNKNLKSGSIDPKYIQSLQLQKLGNVNTIQNADGTHSVTEQSNGDLFKSAVFTLNAVNDLNLEKKILDYIGNNPQEPKVTFQYGYVKGPKSPVYHGIITGMGMSEDFYTITLTVSWTGVGSKYNTFTQATINKICAKKYTKYSDLVNDIATSQGWKVSKIYDTSKISSDSIEYPTIQDTPIGYIRSKILPYVVGPNGEGKFRSLFRNESNGEGYYFVPTSFLVSHKVIRNFNFIVRMLPNGQVLNFKPKLVDGVAAAAALVSGKNDSNKSVYGTVTRDTKELVKVQHVVAKKDADGNIINPNDSSIFVQKSAVSQYSAYDDVLSYAESIIKDDFSAYCYSTAINASASMEILGDPELNILDLINVLPMYPAKSKSSGSVMHPSGGTYMIKKIIETIGATYTTSLELIKMNDTMTLSGKFIQPPPPVVPKPEPVPPAFKVGDRVWFLGATHYISSYPGSQGYNNVKNMPGWAKITIINEKLLNTPGAHPYHLVYENWAETHVYGWVDYGTFEKR